MVLGWYNIEHPLKLAIASVVALITILGIFSKRFHKGIRNRIRPHPQKYNKWTSFFINHKITSFGIVAATVAVLVWLMSITTSTLVPNEDTGTLFCMVDMPPGTSQERTEEVLNQLDGPSCPDSRNRISPEDFAGYSFMAGQGATYGTFILKLKNWEERKRADQTSDAILGKLYGLTSVIKDGRVMIFAPPMISGYSLTNGFEIKMQDRTGGDVNAFFAVVQGFLAQLNQQPEVQRPTPPSTRPSRNT